MLVSLDSQYSKHSYILYILLIAYPGYCQYVFRQTSNYELCILIGGRKQSFLSIDIFTCLFTVEFITFFTKTMETVHRVQIKVGIILLLVYIVPDRAVCDFVNSMIIP